jgi:hypothetical protein
MAALRYSLKTTQVDASFRFLKLLAVDNQPERTGAQEIRPGYYLPLTIVPVPWMR